MFTEKRIVVKLGTSTIAHTSGNLNIRTVRELCRILSDLKNANNEVILVSSGAIAMGYGKLGFLSKPDDIPTKQASAAVGQCELMYFYDKLFAEFNHVVAQILLTGADVNDEDRFRNFKNTISRLLELRVLPIINENDSIATDEIVIGDNDTLAAIVAKSVNADLLILLSDIDGLYTADPNKQQGGELIREVHEITDEIAALAGEASTLGSGGMCTKIEAARIVNYAGCDMIIANGKNPKLLYDIADGKAVGSRFFAKGK